MSTHYPVFISWVVLLFLLSKTAIGQERHVDTEKPAAETGSALGDGRSVVGVVPARGGPIQVTVTPSILAMEKITIGSIQAVVPHGATEVVFHAGVGEVIDITSVSTVRYAARYRIPTDYLPRVDVIGVSARYEAKRIWGYAAVLIHGMGQAGIMTRPGGKATIRIQDQSFGPVQADENGVAVIQVEVPPGERFGYDDFGNPVELGVPPVTRTAIFAASETIELERSNSVSLLGVVVSKNGSTDRMSTIQWRAEKGRVEAAKSLGDGVFSARYVPPDDGEGSVGIEVFVPGDDLPPARIEISIVPRPEPSGEEAVREMEPALPSLPRLYTGLTIGPAWNFGTMSALQLTGDVGYRMVLKGELFLVGMQVGFGFNFLDPRVLESNDMSTAFGAMDASDFNKGTKMFFVTYAASFAWQRFVSTRMSISPYLNVGGAVINNQFEGVDSQDNHYLWDETGHSFLIGGGVNLEWPMGRLGAILAGVRYAFLPGTIHMDTMDARVSVIYLDFGYRFWLFKPN